MLLKRKASQPTLVIRGTGKEDGKQRQHGGSSHKSSAATHVDLPRRCDGDHDREAMFPFLLLPYELRLEIYELLLCSPDPVVVSPRRKQLHVGVETVLQGNIYLRAPRPKPFKRVFQSKDHRPHVELLRTCRQVNEEGTPILYGKNHFLVGHLIPAPYSQVLGGYYPVLFFLWYLRQATLNDITSITFRKACFCSDWVAFDDKEWTTTGPWLRRRCFPTPAPAHFPPSPRPAKDTFSLINNNILLSLRPGFWLCHKCKERWPEYYP